MTFLNAILLGGVAAASIPIIIHLLNRFRYRVVKWGAMHFLDVALQQQRRRLQLEQLLLLLIRCLILGILALSMARPVITGLSSLVGATKTSLVVLLDNSYSMDYGGRANGNFTQARETTATIIDKLSRGSDASVILMAGGATPLLETPAFDLSRLNKELMALDAGYGRASVPAAMELGISTISRMQHTYREMVVISDFQKISWSEDDAPARMRTKELFDKMAVPAQLTLVHIGAEGRENVCIESLDYSRLVLGVGQPLQVRANLRNFGYRNYPDLKVYFRVDGSEKGASQISLGPQEQQQVLFTHTFDAAGSHVIEVATDADTLKADNSFQASIPVWDRVPVLLINGDPSNQPLKGETDFLEIALQPFGIAKTKDLTDLIKTLVIELKDLKPEVLGRARAVVLANVRELNDQQFKMLQSFVNNGGGLLVFPGDRINTDYYNRVLAADNGLLPLPLASVGGGLGQSAARTKILTQPFTHPALEMFNNPRNGNLADAEITLWYRSKEKANDPATSVLARFDSGDPFLVEKKVGDGRVIQCAIPCDADWSNLPLRPFYLPLMQRLAVYLASSVSPPRNIEVGKSITAFYEQKDAGKRATLLDPVGRRHELPIVGKGARSLVEFTDTRRPGLYMLTGPDGVSSHYVVNTTREESNLQQLSDTEKQAVAKSMDAPLVKSLKEYQELDRTRRFGREIWRPLFWVVLGLVLAELLLQQWMARRGV
ncbi:MAG: BatA domain-containing protein [Verrucomicrobiota bacterium]